MMSSKMRFGCALALMVIGAGCGNYSNEDLESMSVVPQRQELAANLADPQNAVELAGAAELYKSTHNVTATLNGMLDKLLGLIEAIRHYSPTSRTTESRTWGPFPPSLENPDCRAAMQTAREPAPTTTSTYCSAFAPAATPAALPL